MKLLTALPRIFVSGAGFPHCQCVVVKKTVLPVRWVLTRALAGSPPAWTPMRTDRHPRSCSFSATAKQMTTTLAATNNTRLFSRGSREHGVWPELSHSLGSGLPKLQSSCEFGCESYQHSGPFPNLLRLLVEFIPVALGAKILAFLMAPGSGLSVGHSRHGCGLSPHDKSWRKALLSKGSPEEAGPMQDHLFDELKVSLLGTVMVSATTLYHGPAHGCRRSLGPALSL